MILRILHPIHRVLALPAFALILPAYGQSPTLSTQPANLTVLAPQAATFSVTATGAAPLAYQWKKNGTAISGATAASYTTPPTSSADTGAIFTVTVSNAQGSVTSSGGFSSGNLTVNGPPVILTHPASQTMAVGGAVYLTVSAKGTGLTYVWKKNGTVIAGWGSRTYYATTATTALDGAQYTVTVTNAYGTLTSNVATLTVTTAPAITANPTSQTVYATYPASFSAAASGSAPLTYTWKKGIPPSGATVQTGASATLNLPSTSTGDAGSYYVTVSNSAGSANSTTADLTVNPLPPAPSITSDPQSVSVTAGNTATFSVIATGTGPFTYQWQRDQVNLSGATGASYTTPATTVETDNGHRYRVLVSNVGGTTTSNAALLTVTAAATAPTITTQPQATTVSAGQRASFSVVASGTGPLTYQWSLNGSSGLPGGDAATYTTPVLYLTNDQDEYRVVVSNTVGSVTSTPVRVTVTSQPVGVAVAPATTSLGANDSAPFAATVTLTSNTAVTWSVQEGAAGGSITAAGVYTAPGAAGTYHVVATSQADPARSAAATVTVLPKSHLPVRP